MATSVTGKATEFIQFTRASNATVTDSDGVIKWAPHNLLLASEQFDSASWLKTNTTSTTPTVTANAAAAPNGQTTADTTAFGLIDAAGDKSLVYQTFTAVDATYTCGVYVKASSAGDVGKKVWIFMYDTAVRGVASVTLTTDWQLLTTSATLTSGANREVDIGTIGSTTGGENQAAVSVLLWGAHLYRSDLGGMQANTSAYPMYNPTTPKNLLGYTEDLTNAAWTKTGSTVTANAAISPSGLTTGDLCVEDTSTGAHGVSSGSVTLVANTSYAWSVYVKAAGRNWAWINAYDGANRRCWFDLANGVTGTVAAGCTAAITSVGNGWYRLSVIRASGGATGSIAVYAGTADNSTSHTGDGTSGIYLWGAQLSDSASLDTYSPVYGAAVTSAAYYGPRRDFDPVTLACKGLLVEEQRTNLINQSGFTNGVTDAGTRGGLLTATTFYNYLSNTSIAFGHDGTTSSFAYNSITPAASTAYVFSTFVRMDDGNAPVFGSMVPANGANDFCVSFGGTLPNMMTATITNMGSSIYRVAVSVTTGGSPIAGVGVLKYNTNSNRTFRVTGYQLEAGSFPTSYIPTGAATATRNSDVASVSTQAFPYSSTESTIVAAFSKFTTAQRGAVVTLGSSSIVTANSLSIDAQNDAKMRAFSEVSGANPYLNANVGTYTADTVNKLSIAYGLNNANAAANGTAGVTDTTADLPLSIDLMQIGAVRNNTAAATIFLNGHIRQITYLPRRISNTELQTRTQ